jgi:hypothetical protein
LTGGVVWQAHWGARIRGRRLLTHPAGGRKPAFSLRPAQVQRASQQPHGIGARRPHPAGLKVPHRALAQLGARSQLLLRQQRPVPARPHHRAERAGRRRGADQLLHIVSLVPVGEG